VAVFLSGCNRGVQKIVSSKIKGNKNNILGV